MSLIKDIAVYHFLPARAMLLLAGILMLGACASQQTAHPDPPHLHNSGPEIQIADVDVLAVSPAMDEFLERYVTRYADMDTRMYLLMNAVSPNGVLGFEYNPSFSLTSTEAFDSRSGNCIGFANMMIALARRAGLKAYYQEVFRRPEWSSREDTVLLVKHINVILKTRSYTYVVDVSGIKMNPNMRRRVIKDNYARALYVTNLGADAMFDGDLPTAYAYLSKAIDMEPSLTDSWVNIGVVFGRNDQLDDARFAFQRALEIDDTTYSALSNLYEVYIAQEDFEAAQGLQAAVEKYRWGNPYYLLKMSDEALELERFEESISLLQRAIQKKRNDHQLYFALAKTQYLSGEIASAEDNLLRARELAPESEMALYDRPLNELVKEE